MKRVGLAALIALGATAAWGQTIYTTTDPPEAIPDVGAAACQDINVPSTGDLVGKLTVRVSITHPFIGDLRIQLESPAPTQLHILNRPGRSGSGFGNDDNLSSAVPILYSDTAPSGLSAEDMGDGCSGTIGVTAGCPDNYLPDPDPSDTPPGAGTNLAIFNGEDPASLWRLCVNDAQAGNAGTLTSWSMTIEPAPIFADGFESGTTSAWSLVVP